MPDGFRGAHEVDDDTRHVGDFERGIEADLRDELHGAFGSQAQRTAAMRRDPRATRRTSRATRAASTLNPHQSKARGLREPGIPVHGSYERAEDAIEHVDVDEL